MSGYRIKGSREVFRGEVISVRVDEITMPSGRVVEREVIAHRGAVGVVPLNTDGEVILVKQYRHPAGESLWEIPAGKLANAEKPADCAYRELIEEIGQAPGTLTKLASFYTTPGYSDEVIHIFLAEELRPEPEDAPEEEIEEVKAVAITEAVRMIAEGRIKDGKTVAAIGLTALRLEGQIGHE
ncbi:MAG: NUDIX hydrolase [Actinomycetota bacterium]